MSSRTYTNTSNWKGILGLIVLTLATSYVAANATEIVNGTITFAKNTVTQASYAIRRKGKKEVKVFCRNEAGVMEDTGFRVWR
jgi:hypothetical protein